jgi:serine/threonine protein kinase
MAGSDQENADLQFGRFKVLKTLGRGGMGQVYLAEDPVIGRKVAIKIVSAEPGLADDELKELHARFEREFQSAGTLSHPNIVTVYDVGTQGDDTFIAMEFLPGKSWGDILKSERSLSFSEVAEFAKKICSALDYAHDSGIVHRDIKPANILVARNGEPKVTDFGVVKLTSTNLTRTGTVVGTPSYMSPEQITGEEVAGASDQFAIGVILYQMLTGQLPFSGENPTTILYKIVHSTPPLPGEQRSSLPEALDNVLMRALEKKPEDRFPSCSELAAALHEALGVVTDTMEIDQTLVLGHTLAEGPQAPKLKRGRAKKRRKKPKKKRRGLLIASIVSLLAATGVAGLYLNGVLPQFAPAPPPPPPPEEDVGPLEISQTINVSSDQAGAMILVNGLDTGLVAPADVPLEGIEGDELMIELQRDGQTVARTSLLLAASMPPGWVAIEEVPPETFVVTSSPQGAEVYLNNELVADLTPTEIQLLPGEHYDLRVEMPEYKAEGLSFDFPDSLAESSRQSRRLSFSLDPKIPDGRIVFTAPYPVRVEIAGERFLLKRSHDITLRPDTYDIRLTSSEVFLDETRSVTVKSQDQLSLNLPPAVDLRVFAQPGNCRVYVNEKYLDETPFNTSLVPGSYEFRFEWNSLDETRTILQRVTRDSEQVFGSLDEKDQ